MYTLPFLEARHLLDVHLRPQFSLGKYHHLEQRKPGCILLSSLMHVAILFANSFLKLFVLYRDIAD